MTDPRIEAAARALCERQGYPSGGTELATSCGFEENWEAFSDDAQAALEAADAAAWMPMSDAPRGRTDILAKTRPDIYPEDHIRSSWNNLSVVIRHEGIINDDFDIGWSVAAPVGYGGMPDEWFVGWRPLPKPPTT